MSTKKSPKPTPHKATSTKPPRFHAKILTDAMGKEEINLSNVATPILRFAIVGMLVHVTSLFLSRGEERTQRRTIIDRTFIVKGKLTPEPHVIISTKPAKVRTKRAR